MSETFAARPYDGAVTECRSSRGRRWSVLLAIFVCWVSLFSLPGTATAEDGQQPLQVTIDSLSPEQLSSDATIEMSGRIENPGDEDWTSVQAYLVMAPSPFTTRDQVETAVSNDSTYIGDRVIETGLFDEVGDVEAGETVQYRLKVPLSETGATGAQGAYPVGVQLLATDDAGERSTTSVAKATTFIPWLDEPRERIPTGLVWSFVLDPHGDDTKADTHQFVRAVGSSGRLRRQLDFAASTATEARTLVIDPAVLDAARNLAEGSDPYGDTDADQRADAERFYEDLLDLARRSSVWVADYDQPDLAALTASPSPAGPLRAAIDNATQSALDEHQLSGRQAHWTMPSPVTGPLIEALRREGDDPMLTHKESLPDWDHRDGSLVTVNTDAGPGMLAVDDGFKNRGGPQTTATLRQWMLTQATLANLSIAADPESKADAVTFVDPSWVPERGASTADLSSVFDDDELVDAVTLDRLMATGVQPYSGELADTPLDEPLDADVLTAAGHLADAEETIAAVSASDEHASNTSREIASAVSLRWRDVPDRAERHALDRAEQLDESLSGIEVLGPANVTLSGSQGSFPLTINNPTSLPIRVSVELSATNPALQGSVLDPIEVAPGERRTINAEVDLGRQSSTSLTAQAVADDMKIGRPATFNVRSSQVGTIVWIAMGIAVAGVVIAMGRRFSRRGFRRRSETDEELADG